MEIPNNPFELIFSKRQWEVYYLKEIKELTNKEVADFLKISESNVRDMIMFYKKKVKQFEETVNVYYDLDKE